MRDINNGVRPVLVKVTIATTPFMWFAAYIADIATDSSMVSNSLSIR